MNAAVEKAVAESEARQARKTAAIAGRGRDSGLTRSDKTDMQNVAKD